MGAMANLAVSVTARTGGLARGLRKGQQHVRAFGGAVANVTRRLAMMSGKIALLAGGAGVAALGMMTRQSLKTIDATAKLSDRLGMATQQLTGLQHAAVIMGSSAEGMNKSLEQMSRRLGEAQTGTGEALESLDALGLSADALVKAGPEEAFRQIADAIASLPSAAAQADAAYNLFGRRGMEMINLLKLGRKGIDELVREAERMGFTFSRFDASKVEAANDAVARLKGSIRGIANQFAILASPYIERAANALTVLTGRGKEAGQAIVTAMEKSIMYAIALADSLKYTTNQRLLQLELIAKRIQMGWYLLEPEKNERDKRAIRELGYEISILEEQLANLTDKYERGDIVSGRARKWLDVVREELRLATQKDDFVLPGIMRVGQWAMEMGKTIRQKLDKAEAFKPLIEAAETAAEKVVDKVKDGVEKVSDLMGGGSAGSMGEQRSVQVNPNLVALSGIQTARQTQTVRAPQLENIATQQQISLQRILEEIKANSPYANPLAVTSP